MKIYHFTDNGNITVFKNIKPKRNYSMATGNGIYFTTDYEKGQIKYGEKAKYCYVCEYTNEKSTILDLKEFDSMYFEGKKIHSSSLVSLNFKKAISGEEEYPEPEILIESLSNKAYKWLINKGFSAISGMDYWGYACPEFVVLNPRNIKIVEKIIL